MKKSNRLTTKQVKTTPIPFTHTNVPEKIAKKMPVKVTKKKKIARASLPNIAGAETTASRNKGTGMNQENSDRKAMRMRQGL